MANPPNGSSATSQRRTSDRRSTPSFNLHPARGCMGSGGLHGLQNRWSASLAMSTDGSFPSRPRQFLNSTPHDGHHIPLRSTDTFPSVNMRSESNAESNPD